MQDNSYQKWLIGCGAGCAGVLVVIIAVGLGGYFLAKRTVEDFKDIAETVSQVEEQYGEVNEFTPETDGHIPADRVEAFLAVRTATAQLRSDIRSDIGSLEHQNGGTGKRERNGFWSIIKTVRSGVGIIPKVASLQGQRSQALLQHQMGLGEYTYIYVLAYYSWLGKDPGDGPRHLRMSENNTVNWDPGNDAKDAQEARRLHTTREVRRSIVAMLGNALDRDRASQENHAWIGKVEAELLALESEGDRLPWKDGVPREIEESFEPYRADFEDSYDPTVNSLELMNFGHD